MIWRSGVTHPFIEQFLKRLSQIGEFANDYIEVRREYTDWTGAQTKSDEDRNVTAEVHMVAGDRHGRPDIGHSRMRKEQTGDDEPHENGLTPIDEKSAPPNGSTQTESDDSSTP